MAKEPPITVAIPLLIGSIDGTGFFFVLSILFYKSSNELNTYPLNLPLAIYFSTYSSHLQVFTSQLLFKDLPVLSNIIYFIKYYYFDKLLSQSFSSSY